MILLHFFMSCMHSPQLPELKHGIVIGCELSSDFPRGPAQFSEYDDRGVCLLSQEVRIQDGLVELPVLRMSGEGTLRFEGSPDLRVEWSNFLCEQVDPPPSREVCGRVANGLGEDVHVRVSDGARIATRTASRRGEFCVRADGTSLRVKALRYDGALEVAAGADWNPDDGVPFVLPLPEHVQGGVGIAAEPLGGESFRILQVVQDMPAASSGLEAGMVVHVSEARTGDVGTALQIHVHGEAQPRELVRERFSWDPSREWVTLPGEVRTISSNGGVVF